jgi:hypothetical protein
MLSISSFLWIKGFRAQIGILTCEWKLTCESPDVSWTCNVSLLFLRLAFQECLLVYSCSEQLELGQVSKYIVATL